MKTATLRIMDRDRKPLEPISITDSKVRGAIEEYNRMYPLNDYPRTAKNPHVKTWLESGNYDYAIRYRGRCYPPKCILRLAIGLRAPKGFRFFGGEGASNANWVLQELGFEVIRECMGSGLSK